ncbi:MAG: hypothetical protein RIE73_33340 [Coleofasciculus sp. C1-SOL-03]
MYRAHVCGDDAREVKGARRCAPTCRLQTVRSPVPFGSIQSCDRSLFPIPINFIGRTSVRPYVQATNVAIACSRLVNSIVRSQPDFHFRQFDRAQVNSPYNAMGLIILS